MHSEYEKMLTMAEEQPLSKTLARTLRLAQELHDAALEKWVRLELHGYWNTNPALTEDVVVPTYRTVPGYYTDDFGRPFRVTDPKLSYINEIRLRFGVIEIEGLTDAKGPLAFRPLEFTDLIREHLGVVVTTFNFYPNGIPPVLAAIRTQLSDYLVARRSQLEKKMDNNTQSPEEEVIELKPNFYGIGINLKALFRKMQGRGR